MWSRVPLPRLKPACSIGRSGTRNTSSLAFEIRISMTRANKLPSMLSREMPLWLLQ